MEIRDLFHAVLAAVLAANMLTAAWLWAFINYSRLEREGRENERGTGSFVYLIWIAACPLVLLGLLYTTLSAA